MPILYSLGEFQTVNENTNNLLLERINVCETVKSKFVIVGIMVVLIAIPTYDVLPPLITETMNKLTFGNQPSPMANQIFSQLGLPPIPPVQSVVAFIQDSCIGLVVAGLGIIAFGLISKKIPRQSPLNISLVEATKRSQEDEDADLKAIHLLQERLAKGEITSSQYQNLRKLLEEKR